MNNTGTEPQQISAPNEHEEAPAPVKARRSLSPLMLVLLVFILLLSVYIGIQLFGVLFGMIFPPDAPVPSDVVELSHDNLAYGVDDWLYGTTQNGCEVVQFYIEQDGVCDVPPGVCGTGAFFSPNGASQNLGSCYADVEFSIFTMRWNVEIATGYGGDSLTKFRLKREIFWIGTPPSESAVPTP